MVKSPIVLERREGPETSPTRVMGPDSRPSRPFTCGGVFKVASIRSTCDRV